MNHKFFYSFRMSLRGKSILRVSWWEKYDYPTSETILRSRDATPEEAAMFMNSIDQDAGPTNQNLVRTRI